MQCGQRVQYDLGIEPGTCKIFHFLFLLRDWFFTFSIKMFLKVEEQKRKYKLKTMKYIHIVKLRAGHLMLSKMNDLAAQIRPSWYYSEPKMSVTNSPCLEGWRNDSSMVSNLSISFPNSLAD